MVPSWFKAERYAMKPSTTKVNSFFVSFFLPKPNMQNNAYRKRLNSKLYHISFALYLY